MCLSLCRDETSVCICQNEFVSFVCSFLGWWVAMVTVVAVFSVQYAVR
jgi:hypothetical protein